MSIDFRKVNRQVALAFLVLSVVGCTSSPTPTSSVEIQVMPTARVLLARLYLRLRQPHPRLMSLHLHQLWRRL